MSERMNSAESEQNEIPFNAILVLAYAQDPTIVGALHGYSHACMFCEPSFYT